MRTPLVLLLLMPLLAACGNLGALAGPPTLTSQEAEGKAIFGVYCSRCHETTGDIVIVGPSLAGIAHRAGERVPGMDAPAYLENSIVDPGAYLVEGFPEGGMPQNISQSFTEADIAALVAYLMTLKQ